VLIKPSALVLGILTFTWVLVAAFSVSAEPSSGIPYAPIWFGMSPGKDYNVETLSVFSGGFQSLYHAGPNADSVLRAAQEQRLKVKVAVGEINPCRYWNSSTYTFDYDLFMADSREHIAIAARYCPDTVVAVSLLNEPHWINHTTATCNSGVPPKYLYELVRRVREEFAKYGVTDILMGVNSHPGYLNNSIGFPKYVEPPGGGQLTEAQKGDGTINLLWIYYHSSNDLSWARGQQEIARKYGWKIIYNANASKAGTQLAEVGKWHCQQEDAAFVTWWSWAVQNQQVPISSLHQVREACGQGAPMPTPVPPTPTPTPTATPKPYLANGSFEQGPGIPAPWRANRNLTLEDRRVCETAHHGSCSFRMVGAIGYRLLGTEYDKSLSQVVNISGSAGDRFTISGWSKASNPLREGGPYCLQARVFHTDGTKRNYRACFAKRTHDWQRRQTTFTTVKDYKKIVVYLLDARQSGKAWFDDVRLVLH